MFEGVTSRWEYIPTTASTHFLMPQHMWRDEYLTPFENEKFLLLSEISIKNRTEKLKNLNEIVSKIFVEEKQGMYTFIKGVFDKFNFLVFFFSSRKTSIQTKVTSTGSKLYCMDEIDTVSYDIASLIGFSHTDK